MKKRYDVDAYIFVTFKFEAVHSHLDAPKEVYFLRQPHKHIFNVRVDIEIFYDEDIKFIALKRFLEKLPIENDLNNQSCEMICDFFQEAINHQYNKTSLPNRFISIEVSEDGENGAYKTYNPS
jgi:hypothetical protein